MPALSASRTPRIASPRAIAARLAAPRHPNLASELPRRRLERAARPAPPPPPSPCAEAVRAPRPRPAIGRTLPAGTVAFVDAAEAWFWTLGALAARRDGTGGGGGSARVRRPCDPDDVIRALDLLHRRGGIDLGHARVLRRWGERRCAPLASRATERDDALLWNEALDRLGGLLRAKGIVAGME